MFNVKLFLEDYNIPYFTEGKNTQKGWINIQCPLCRDKSNHGGFNTYTGHYNCWNCGHTWKDKVISKLLNIKTSEARTIIERYETVTGIKNKEKNNALNIDLPKGSTDLKKIHRDYLIKRNFDPEEIERLWKIKGTNHIGDYKFRIMIPVFLYGKMISYLGRDITGKSGLRYKTCVAEKEVMPMKDIVYGSDYIQNRKAIIVEGCFDAWRFGPGAVATFGINYTKQQVLFLARILDEAYILYDRQAESQANKLCKDLAGLINHVEIIELDYKIKDPADMSPELANEVKKELLNY